LKHHDGFFSFFLFRLASMIYPHDGESGGGGEQYHCDFASSDGMAWELTTHCILLLLSVSIFILLFYLRAQTGEIG
jgi:hypothetical protein